MNIRSRRQFTGLVYIICARQPNSDRVLFGPWNRIPQSPQSSDESLQVFLESSCRSEETGFSHQRRMVGVATEEGWTHSPAREDRQKATDFPSYLLLTWILPGDAVHSWGGAEGAGFLPSVNAYQKHPVRNCLEMRILVGSI